MAIRAIVFDCFGVLVEDGWLAFRGQYFPASSDGFEAVTDLNKQYDAGLITYDDFAHGAAELAGVSYEAARRAIGGRVVSERFMDYIQQLKPAFQIGLLSNVGMDIMPVLFTPAQAALFDEVVLSYQIGRPKPDALMYETICAKLGVLPEEAIFIDDQARNVEGAKQAGMHAFQYTEFESMQHILAEAIRA